MKQTLTLFAFVLSLGLATQAQVDNNCDITSFPYIEEFTEAPDENCWCGIQGCEEWGWSSSSGGCMTYSIAPVNYHIGALSTPYINTSGEYSVRFRVWASGYLTGGCTEDSYLQFKVYMNDNSGSSILKSRCINYNFINRNGAYEDSVSFTVSSGNDAYLVFVVEGEGWVAMSNLNVFLDRVTFRRIGNANNDVQEVADSCTVTAFPFSCGVETADELDCLRISDADGDGDGWSWGHGSAGSSYGYNSYSSIISFSNDGGAAYSPDNWLYTQSFKIPSQGNYSLSWYERRGGSGTEHYSVSLSFAPTNTAYNTNLYTGNVSSGSWVKREVSLAAYAGQFVRFAFRHHNSNNSNTSALMIDNISIAPTSSTGIEETSVDNVTFCVVGRELTISGQQDESIIIADMVGRIVYQNNCAASPITIKLPAAGVYVVRIGDELTRKVAVAY